MKKSHSATLISVPMSKVCSLTGKGPSSGHNVSHSVRRTKRRFLPNLQWKRFFDPLTNALVRIRVSVAGMRTLSKPMSKRDEARMMKKIDAKEAAKA
jgi:large subunit ribosomal protein L28